ncbi:MAG: tetratricopeptide repeat protein [Xanthomonadales bacterium]|nr:tetratricopeptide repeat protein [Xanthomonadales bacterium]
MPERIIGLLQRLHLGLQFLPSAACLLLWGAAATAQDLPSPNQVLALPDATRERFEVEVIKAARSPQVRLRKLVEFMFEAEGLGLEYDNSRSRTVAEAIADRQANCLSFTLTFMELARRAGFHTHMMESEQALVWFVEDRTLFLAGHVSAQVRLGRHRFEVNFDPNAPLLRRDQQTVSDDRALAHFYNNRAAELMAEGDYALAQRYFDQALKLDSEMVSTLNNQGVLLMRQGSLSQAEAVYQHALRIDPDSLSVMTNLINLYRLRGESARADKLEERLEQTQRKNPLHHFVVGIYAEQSGNHSEALTHFETAARLDRREPLFELALSRVHKALGQESEAAKHARRAKRLTERGRNAIRNVDQRMNRR